jgi:hypothetical protein
LGGGIPEFGELIPTCIPWFEDRFNVFVIGKEFELFSFFTVFGIDVAV